MESEKTSFIERFVEVCGTSEPAKIQRLLNISYQAARNYLRGRLPDSYVLRTIARRTPYSINWLLTGEGDKFVAGAHAARTEDTLISARHIRDLVRSECREVVNELLTAHERSQKVVVLPPSRVKSEKVKEPSTFPEVES